jgi:hypothetical protein
MGGAEGWTVNPTTDSATAYTTMIAESHSGVAGVCANTTRSTTTKLIVGLTTGALFLVLPFYLYKKRRKTGNESKGSTYDF